VSSLRCHFLFHQLGSHHNNGNEWRTCMRFFPPCTLLGSHGVGLTSYWRFSVLPLWGIRSCVSLLLGSWYELNRNNKGALVHAFHVIALERQN